MTGPTVVDVTRFGFHAAPTFVVLTFSEDLDPTRAGDVSNYRLAGPTGSIGLRSAVYDAATRTVTLSPDRLLSLNFSYQVTVNGSTPAGVTDRAGNLIDGDRDGRPGGDFTTAFGREALRVVTATDRQRVSARRLRVPAIDGSSLPGQIVATMLSTRFRRLLARRPR